MGTDFTRYLQQPAELRITGHDGQPDSGAMSGTLADLINYAHSLLALAAAPHGLTILTEGDRPMDAAEVEAFYASPFFPKQSYH